MRTNRRTVGIPGTARRRVVGNGRRAADGAAPRGRMPEGGRAERRGRAEPEDEKKARWNLAAVERKGMRSKPPRCPQDDGRPRGAEGRWVRRQETEMDLTETYMKRLASCTSHVGKKWGSVCAALAGRNPPRASACRNAPPAAWKSRSVGGRVPQRSSKCAIALWEARARAERPPLWGSDDVSAMRNYRYRHRDSPYVARRSGERTSRAGRPWAVGGELPGARWRGRPVCAMRSAVQGQRRH